MKRKNLTPVWHFLRTHRYRFLMVGMLFMYGCGLLDDEVLNSRQAFVGSFSVNQTEVGTSNSENYTLSIQAGSNSNEILLSNLRPFKDQVIATVVGNQITIASQSVRINGTTSVKVSGSGTLDGTTIEIDFDFDYGSYYNYNVTGYKL